MPATTPLQSLLRRCTRRPERRDRPAALPPISASNWEAEAYLRYEEEMRRN